jgi:hypothetical protein
VIKSKAGGVLSGILPYSLVRKDRVVMHEKLHVINGLVKDNKLHYVNDCLYSIGNGSSVKINFLNMLGIIGGMF